MINNRCGATVEESPGNRSMYITQPETIAELLRKRQQEIQADEFLKIFVLRL